jgi:hypothetical protein
MADQSPKHESRWTSIYWGNDEADAYKLKPCVRLTPNFMSLEAVGFPHGVGLAGYFETEKQAIEYAKSIDTFMDELMRDILDGEAND